MGVHVDMWMKVASMETTTIEAVVVMRVGGVPATRNSYPHKSSCHAEAGDDGR